MHHDETPSENLGASRGGWRAPWSHVRRPELWLGGSAALATAAVLVTAHVRGSIPVPGPTPDIAVLLESQGEFEGALRTVQARLDSEPRIDFDPEILRTELRLNVREGRDAQALALLQRSTGCLDAGEEALVRATLELRNNDPQRALDALQSPLPDGLQSYAAALEAEACRRLARWSQARSAAERGLAGALPVEMQERLRVVHALCALQLGDLDTVRRLAPELGETARRDDETGLLLLDAARASAAAGNVQQADAWRVDLLQARITPAESAYAALRQASAARLAALPDAMLKLARFEARSARYPEARARLRDALQTTPERAERAEIRLAIAESYQKQGDLRRCLATLDRALAETRGSRFEPELLRARARAQKRLGRAGDAIVTYQQLARRFPTHAVADDALYEVGWIREARREFRSAERAYLRCVRRYPRGSLADDAQLRAGLCALRDRRPGEARQHLATFVERFATSGLLDNALYWRMVAEQRLGHAASALAIRDRLEKDFPRSYYTVLARQRVERGLASARLLPVEHGAGVARPLEVEDGMARAQRVSETYDAALEGVRRGAGLRAPADFANESRLWRFLLDYGFGTEASWEERRLERRYDEDAGALLEMLSLCHTRGAHERLVRLAYRLSQLLPDPQWQEPLEVLLYPAPYSVTVASAAAQNGLSHSTVLGLMRQESAFDPHIDSAVGARGLMQLMPQVGRRIGREAGRGDLHADELYRPELNVALGCRLLAYELRRANGNLTQALAAYNAGTEPAAAWRARVGAHEPPELYLDVVEYFETRTYLETVLGNREVYRRVYALP